MFIWCRCDLCGKWKETDEHHVVPRGRHIKDNKRKRLCRSCHSDVHGLYSEAFKKKYGKNRADFIKVKTLMPKGGFYIE